MGPCGRGTLSKSWLDHNFFDQVPGTRKCQKHYREAGKNMEVLYKARKKMLGKEKVNMCAGGEGSPVVKKERRSENAT